MESKDYDCECVIKFPELLMFHSHELKISKEHSAKFLFHKPEDYGGQLGILGCVVSFTHQLILSY